MRLAPGTRRVASLWLALAALAVGCSPVLEKKPITKERFVWQVPAPEAFAGPRSGVLRVGVVRVSPPFQNRGFVLRTGDRYASDFYNEFAAPPGTLLRDELVQWLGAASRFAAVVRSSETTYDWVLETNIDSLFADVSDASKPPEATLGFTVRLLDARGSGTPIRFEKRYTTTEAAADRAPRSIAEAWSRALARLLPDLAADLDTATARKP